MNVKARRNLRALGKIGVLEISKTQICFAVVPLLFLFVFFYLFWIHRLSETIFAAQSTFLIAQLAKFKIGTIEFEKSTEHRYKEAKSQPIFER